MNCTIHPGLLSGDIRAITSKSAAHRALICAALADGVSRLRIDDTNKDILCTCRCLESLGARIEIDAEIMTVHPIGAASVEGTPLLDCGESGSTLRFMLPVAASLRNKTAFDGHGRLPERPLSDLTEQMKHHKCAFSAEKLPFAVTGKLTGGRFSIAGNVSSQYITGLLLAAPQIGEEVEILLTSPLESASYVELTTNIMLEFGVVVEKTENGFRVPAGSRYRAPEHFDVEGDWSNAAFFHTAAYLGGEVRVSGLREDSAQGDRKILPILEQMKQSTSDLTVDVSDIPDLVPILSVAAAFREDGCKTVFANAARLRLKESDRLLSTETLIRALGGQAESTEDTLSVCGGGLRGGSVDSFNDHRIVMAAAVAATACRVPVTIVGAEAYEKSYPKFAEHFEQLGGKIHVELR
ncbi:MAG: 3-phosphoshikimate 1-carboxyvinyltransferase [Ruminococcaceae bacterium]|nr:3-phosphoshikimate 1-carboxyvinyltransferase [Oscillospiraceae bacterium]